MPLNILSVNKYFYLKGGSEAVFFGEKRLLEEAGHRVVPFAMQDPKNLTSDYSRFFVDNIDYDKPGLTSKFDAAAKIIFSVEARRKMTALLEETTPDVAHFHIFQHQISPSVFGPLRAKKVPIVLTLHDLKPICANYKMYVNGKVCEACKGNKFYNTLIRRCTKGSLLGSLINTIEMYVHHYAEFYQQVETFIAVSQFYRDKMIEFGFPRDKISYIPNFIRTEEYPVAMVPGKYALYFGRLSEEKGIKYFIQAAKLNPHITHKIVGTGPLESELKKMAHDLNLKNVEFLGFFSGDRLKSIIAHALTVVVPSVWYENCPMTVLEAYATARPVIGSSIGGITELIEDGVDGRLVPPHDPNALAQAISGYFANPEAATQQGQRGLTKVKVRFDEASHIDRLLECYDRARDT